MPAIKTEKQRYARGLKRRKQVLGAKYVAERLKNRHPFTDEFQSLITRYAWGELWTRPKFDDRTRRLLVLAMLVATEELGRIRTARARWPGARTVGRPS